jgi:hypothetical protein
MAYKKPRVIKCFVDDGKPKSTTWPTAKAKVKEIKKKLNIPPEKMIIMKGAKGTKILKDSDEIDLSEQGVTINVQPNVVQGGFFKRTLEGPVDLEKIDFKRNRKARYLISQLLEYGEEKYRREKLTIQVTSDLKYVCIPDFPLPALWKQRRVPLLIHIPSSYPDTPPLGFYVPHGTCLKRGGRHSHQFCGSYYSEPDLHSMGWDWFCLHLTNSSDWQPKDDPLKPHKFWNYIDIIRLGLSNLEITGDLT